MIALDTGGGQLVPDLPERRHECRRGTPGSARHILSCWTRLMAYRAVDHYVYDRVRSFLRRRLSFGFGHAFGAALRRN